MDFRVVAEELDRLRAEVAQLGADRQELIGTVVCISKQRDAAEAANARLTARVGVLQVGCKCDPPGSGEEFCSGACYARAEVARLRAALSETAAEWDGLPHQGAFAEFAEEVVRKAGRD